MKTYHYTIGFPTFEIPAGRLELKYTRHAQLAAESDRYGTFKLPMFADLRELRIVEVTIRDDGTVDKYVARGPIDSWRDLTIVVTPDGWVKTCWLNESNDKHTTLNVNRYARV